MKKRHTSTHGNELKMVRAPHACSGCGRILPNHSWVEIRCELHDFTWYKHYLCSDCQKIIYGCSEAEDYKVPCAIRSRCRSCDDFPFCDKVDYIRNTSKGDLCLSDVDREDMWEEKDGALVKR